MAYYKTRNAGIRNNGTRNSGETAEYPGTVVKPWWTSEYPWNTNVTLTEHPETREAYKTKNNYSVFKDKEI